MKFSMFNKVRKFNINSDNFTYESLKDLYNNNGKDHVYPLTAIYINRKTKFEPAPVFATDKFFVNIPSHMLDVCEQILSNENAIEAINNGEVGFSIYPYKNNRFNKDCFGVNFVDVE